MTAKVIIREHLRSVFLDFSFTTLVISLLLLNEAIMLKFNFFEDSVYFYTIWFIFFFNGLALTAYGGYIGSKFFAKEFENNIFVSLIVTPLKRFGVFMGKSIAAVLVGMIVVLIIFLQVIFSMLYYGAVPYLFIYWCSVYAYLAFLSYLFSFFLAVSVGVLIRKNGLTMLLSSIYTIASFFVLAFVPMNYVMDSRFYYSLFFPMIGTWYSHLLIEFYAILYNIIYIIPTVGVLWIFVVSLLLFRGVKW